MSIVWTKEQPTQEGYYWYRDGSADTVPVSAFVEDRLRFFKCADEVDFKPEPGAWWAPAVSPPFDPRLEGH